MHWLFALDPDGCALAPRRSAIYAFLHPLTYVPIWFMEQHPTSPEPQGDPTAAFEANLPAFTGDTTRRDGWTPFARRLFLQVLAETGRVSRACEYVGLSRTSAHNLRNRDSLFGAGWDAACLLARNPLADDIYEKGMDGVTDTITRNGEVVAERHRYDGRLSMAVLNRLDKRLDRAEERGSRHLALVRRWDEWLELVGKGDDAAARALLEAGPDEGQAGSGETAQHCQLCQLPESANPTDTPDPPGVEPCWQAEAGHPQAGAWLTHFPPPPGFAGYENAAWDGGQYYERACTPEEAALLDANLAAAEAEERAAAEAERDAWFAELRGQLSSTSRGVAC